MKNKENLEQKLWKEKIRGAKTESYRKNIKKRYKDVTHPERWRETYTIIPERDIPV